MQYIVTLVLVTTVSVVCSVSDQVQLVSESKQISRDPKFIKILKDIFETFKKPQDASTLGKYSESQPDYNQYFVNADPYNQNQLLSAAVEAEKGPSVLDMSPSELSTQGESSESGINSMNTLFEKLIGDDTSSLSSIISNILSLGTGSMEKVLQRVNAFDSLRCIPRLLCQTVAQRQLDSTKVIVTTTSRVTASKTFAEKDDMSSRNSKTIKFLGVDTALGQFMGFLDLFNLKNWALYPYLKGAYEGGQVKKIDECSQRFETCPFSDQQLVYYFNNYNGGFFQSLRSN